MITIFKKYVKITKPNVNSLSPEFWKVVDLINWKSVIQYYEENPVVNQDDESIDKIHLNFI
jgi:hypothetical protein